MKEEILSLVKEMIESKKSVFFPGQTIVQYSGPTIDHNEYVAIIDTVLDGWFGLGAKASLFESEVAKRLDKNYGVYVNSGSSANLLINFTISLIAYAFPVPI